MIRSVFLAVLFFFSFNVTAQQFPSRPVRLVVAYPPGGPADFTARLVAAGLQGQWNQPVIVDNKPGASAMIGADLVARAAPDGYTLLLGTIQSHAMNAGSIRKMLYDPVRDFTPISQATRAVWVLAANPNLKAASLKDLVALAKARPGELNYGSSGIGSVSHLAFEMFAAPLGLKMTHVPYKGTAQAVSDVIDGRVQLVIGDQPTLMPHLKSGRLAAVAVTGATRSALLPQVPSVSEVVPGFDVQPWQGLFGAAGMPAELARRISADLAAALREPQLRGKLAESGVEAAASTPEEFAAHVKRELARWTEAAKSAGIQPE
jgi:tripartite-type tricarboxylate transporter receptor subunit TctC